MSTLETGTIEPQSGTTVTLGASGDAVVIGADALKVNTIKDAGANTILTSDGSGTLSSVNSGLTGNMVYINSATASGDASLSFTSGIDSTYDEYVFMFVNINPASGTNTKFQFQVSTDGGSSYGVNITSTFFYAMHDEADTSTTLTYSTASDLAESTSYQMLTEGIGIAADESASGVLHLFDPSSTASVKHFYCNANGVYNAGSAPYSLNAFSAGYVNSTSAVDAIDFKVSTGNFDGTIYLYGIK